MTLSPTYKPDIYQSSFPAHGSRLVYGTSGLGGVWGEVQEQESIDCILYALENGITAFDTAPSYRHAEAFLGKALLQWKGGQPFISTKVGRLKADTAFDAKLDYSPQGMKDSVRRSLDVLKVDRVDLLFLHEPQWVPLHRIDEILETLLGFRYDGLAGMLGIGGNPSAVFMPYVRKKYFDVISSFCMLDACNISACAALLPVTQREGIAFYAASALHFSLLGNRFEQFVKNRPLEYGDLLTDQDIKHAVAVNELAKRLNIPLSTLSQRYLFSMNEATRVVMGARNIHQIAGTVQDWKAGALPEDVFEQITAMIQIDKQPA